MNRLRSGHVLMVIGGLHLVFLLLITLLFSEVAVAGHIGQSTVKELRDVLSGVTAVIIILLFESARQFLRRFLSEDIADKTVAVAACIFYGGNVLVYLTGGGQTLPAVVLICYISAALMVALPALKPSLRSGLQRVGLEVSR